MLVILYSDYPLIALVSALQVTSKQNHMSSLVSTLCQNVLPNVYQHVQHTVLSLDILPLLIDVIIQPNMRPVSY